MLDDLIEQLGQVSGVSVVTFNKDGDEQNVVGYKIVIDEKSEDFAKIDADRVINDALGVDKQTIDFLKSLDETGLDQVKRLAELNFHKREIVRLEAEIARANTGPLR